MKKKHISLSLFLVALLAIGVQVMAGCGKDKAVDVNKTATTRTIIDMAGREVTLPLEINRVATIGPGPVLNSLVFAVGQGDKIVNGLPEFARNEHWKYQYKFAPNLANQPVVQNNKYQPNVEELMKLKPDVVFLMSTTKGIDNQTTKVLTEAGMPTVCLVWTNAEEVKQAINLVGQVLNREDRAQEYSKYFDDIITRVSKVVDTIPEDKRPRVLHCNTQNMTAPHAISDWWIKQAGGISVTEELRGEARVTENIELSVEQLLKWDPQIIIVSDHGQVNQLNSDSRFKEISAIRRQQVLPSPRGAHPWAFRTSEQPLMLLWAAKTFHPEAFRDLNLEEELIHFYKSFFNYSMTAEEAREILSGGPKNDSGQKP